MRLNSVGGLIGAGVGLSAVAFILILLLAQPHLSIAAMIAIIFLAFWVVVGVMFYGAQENVEAHGLTPAESASVSAWNERAERIDTRMQQVTQASAAASAADSSAVDEEAIKAEKRAAALARKAARQAQRTTNES